MFLSLTVVVVVAFVFVVIFFLSCWIFFSVVVHLISWAWSFLHQGLTMYHIICIFSVHYYRLISYCLANLNFIITIIMSIIVWVCVCASLVVCRSFSIAHFSVFPNMFSSFSVSFALSFGLCVCCVFRTDNDKQSIFHNYLLLSLKFWLEIESLFVFSIYWTSHININIERACIYAIISLLLSFLPIL